MASYIFLPVPSGEMLARAADVVETCRNTTRLTLLRNLFVQGKGKGLMRHLGLGCLKGVREADTLYILMHGRGEANSTRIGAARGGRMEHQRGLEQWVGGAMKAYTMDQITAVLEGEGLSKTFVDLHLLTCGSGLVGNQGNDTDRALASRLRTTMVNAGYRQIMVTGYQGDVCTNIKRNDWFSIETRPGVFTPAVEAAVTFGGRNAVVL